MNSSVKRFIGASATLDKSFANLVVRNLINAERETLIKIRRIPFIVQTRATQRAA